MFFIKYILIFLVFLIFFAMGNRYSKKYSNRVNELEKMNNMLNVFKAKIKFSCLAIQDVFSQIYEDNKNNIGMIFNNANKYMEQNTASTAWQMALDFSKENTSLTYEDYEVLASLGKMLGNTDVGGQVSQIELTKELLQKQIKEAQEEKKKNSKLYKTLGLTVGLAVAIILI